MIRRLLTLSVLAALACSASASRYALIVGVDTYSFITDAAHSLHGAATDTDDMKRVLDLYSFQSDVLLRKDATRANVIASLAKLDKEAQQGDDLVFYFSGRGSIAPDAQDPSSKLGFEPTLVPADGLAKATDFDIRMNRLETWADDLDKKGAHVTIILDTCFQQPTTRDFGRQYNPTARCITRAATATGTVRDVAYRGPGIFLAACPAQGASYEWLVNSSENRWAGAFTDQLANSLVAALYRRENPSYMDAMREVQAFFKDKIRADYMPGLAPYPAMPDEMANAKTYDVPFAGGLNLTSLPADSKLAISMMESAKEDRERSLRVALEITDAPSEAERIKSYTKFSKELADYLKSKVPNSEFAPQGAPPDVVVKLKSTKAEVQATVVGDDLDKAKIYTFTGKNWRKALDDGLGPYLELRGLVTRLYRITSTGQPTWNVPFTFRSQDVAYSKGDTFGLDLTGPDSALVFILDRDDVDGILQLAFPQVGAPYSQKLTGPLHLDGTIEQDTNTGRMMMRAIIVPIKGKGVAEVSMSDDAHFRDTLLKQLRLIVTGMERGQVPWASKTIDLRIR